LHISKLFKLTCVLDLKVANIIGWDSMKYNKYKLAVFTLSFLFFIIMTESVMAIENIIPDFTTFGISFVIIMVVIGTIIAIVVSGGIKYVTPENVLDTEIRKNLYGYITDYPGSHLREIARELNLKPSNAAWHLRKLEQTNLVRSRSIGGKRVYYLVEGGIEARKEAVAESILKNKNAREILLYLHDNPGKHLLEIAHALDLNHHTVKWHIKKMFMAELINGDTSNSAYPVYYPTEIGSNVIQNFSNNIKRAS
jgi:predicted transcriptional regulator